MYQVAGEHRVMPAAAEREGGMVQRVAGGRHDARVIADRKIIAHELSRRASTIGSTLSTKYGSAVLAFCSLK